jgi:4-amino-4-deoxychorismate lyase
MLAAVPEQSVVAVLGRGVVPADTPILRADDLGALRGDGIFETMHVRDGGAWQAGPHLDRLERSAARLELTLPPRADLLDLMALTMAAWPAGAEGALRLSVTRGPEGGGAPTVYTILSPVPAAVRRARRDGLAVVTASLGVAATARPGAPWLLPGAKTLSYAVNMASQRYALGRGAHDVLWVSADGYALEAPTSTLVWLDGDELCTVPAGSTGILAGTTARFLLDHAADAGLRAAERMVTLDELGRAAGVWLCSSVRGVAEVRRLDGVDLGPSPATDTLAKVVGYPR